MVPRRWILKYIALELQSNGLNRALAGRARGRVLGGMSAVESLSGLVTPVWLGAVYAALARDGDASDAYFCMVATALAGLAVLVLRAPKPPPDPSLLSESLMGSSIIA